MRLGQLVTTTRIYDSMDEHPDFAEEVKQCLERYLHMDWGELSEEDWRTNQDAIIHNERLFAAYHTSLGKIWIITECDRSVTTILFPDEY